MNALKCASMYSFCFLVACTPMQQNSDTFLPQKNLQANKSMSGAMPAQKVTSWNVTGQLSKRTEKGVFSGAVNWVQKGPNQYQIRVMGPRGEEAMAVEKHGNIVVYTKDHGRHTARTERELARKLRLENYLENHYWYYWARGLYVPGKVSGAQYNANHQLMQFNQHGYTVSYSQYTRMNGIALPTSMKILGHGSVYILVINNWKI